MMSISVYVCRKSRTATKLVAREETTVQECIHKIEKTECVLSHMLAAEEPKLDSRMTTPQIRLSDQMQVSCIKSYPSSKVILRSLKYQLRVMQQGPEHK